MRFYRRSLSTIDGVRKRWASRDIADSAFRKRRPVPHPPGTATLPDFLAFVALASSFIGRRKTTFRDQGPTKVCSIWLIDVQDINGHSTAEREANQPGFVPNEVLLPVLPTGVKQRNNSAVEIAREIRAFRRVATWTSEAEVLEAIAAVMLPRNDMLDMKRCENNIALMQTAVFASTAGAGSNASSSDGVHAHSPEVFARRCRVFDCNSAMKVPNEM